uniref:Ubiquitin-like-conjugating enzyme ATG10 n=1 Tax=Salix viminalis TaxID=40686 RepID=A0A6N2MBR5_SALVM
MGCVSPSWDGTLSPKDFSVAAHVFKERWERNKSASPSWFWVNSPKGPPLLASSQHVEGYLSLESMCVQSKHHEAHYYDFHIVYSSSFRVPVLYFRAYCSDGRPLLLNDIEKDLPACSSKVLLETKWSFITMEEHPFLNRPWYKLHPCGTSEWMKLLCLGDEVAAKNGLAIELYLLSWFSVVGQVVGLKTPLEMVKSQRN